MLTLLTKSKITQKIILLFVYNPGRRYYINEIARIVDTSAGNTQRALKKIEKTGYLIKENQGNLTYYRTNTADPSYADFKNLVDKTIGIDKILQEELAQIPAIQFAFIFGSYVKGEFRTDSDIDLYVVGEVNEETLYQAVKRAEQTINREINYHFADLTEFVKKVKQSFFHQDIMQNYHLIIGNQNDFERIVK